MVVAPPHDAEERQANVGGGNLPDLAVNDRLVVLTRHDHQAHDECDDRPGREERRAIRQVLQAIPLQQVGAAEANVAHRDTQPHDDARNADNVDQPNVGVIKDELRHETKRRRHRRHGHRVAGHATLRDLREDRGRLVLEGHRVQHARGRVQARVTGRENRRQDDGVHDGRRRADAHAREDKREGRLCDSLRALFGGAQQARIRVRQQRADDRDRADVEENDAPEHRADRARHVALGVLGLAGGHAHELGALEGEASDHEYRDDADETIVEGGVPDRPIRQARRVHAHHPGDHEHARDHEHDDDHDFNGGQPELCLAVDPRRQRVEPDDDHQEGHRPYPRGHRWEPIRHDQARGHQVRGDRHRPVEPIVPPHRKAEGGGNELRGEGLEGARDRLVRTHLTQGLHEEQHHQANRRVGEKRAARAGVGDRLHVARRQATLQLCVGALLHIAGDVIGSGSIHQEVPHLSIVSPILTPNSCVEIGTFFPRSLTRPWLLHARRTV